MPAPIALPDLKAPSGDSQILIWPDPSELIQSARDNAAALDNARQFTLQGLPIAEIRRRMRDWLGHREGLLFVTGHQAELHHPGVWVKNVVINAAANRSGGAALHLAIDTDAPKHLDVRWPAASGQVRTMPFGDDPVIDVTPWSGLVATPSPAHLDQLRSAIQESAQHWPFTPVIWSFLESARRLALDSPSLDATVVNALHELDWSLGLRHQAILSEPIFQCPAYMVFVHALLSRADRLATDYNAALADYRVDAHIRSPSRPMPDMAVAGDQIEVPFWLDNLASAKRSRASVWRRGDRFVLLAPGGAEFDFDPDADAESAIAALSQFLRAHRLRLAPRALTLTIFMRLFIADQFIHGIGGAQYDQVTDRVIARFIGMTPPRFAVATATAYFPTAITMARVCLPCVAREGRRLLHGALGDRKSPLVEQIAALPRRDPRRQEMFFDMHRQLADAVRESSDIKQWRQRFADAEARVLQERAVFDRELFYALQPRERLARLIADVDARFSAASLP
jgi:hypothetical protein